MHFKCSYYFTIDSYRNEESYSNFSIFKKRKSKLKDKDFYIMINIFNKISRKLYFITNSSEIYTDYDKKSKIKAIKLFKKEYYDIFNISYSICKILKIKDIYEKVIFTRILKCCNIERNRKIEKEIINDHYYDNYNNRKIVEINKFEAIKILNWLNIKDFLKYRKLNKKSWYYYESIENFSKKLIFNEIERLNISTYENEIKEITNKNNKKIDNRNQRFINDKYDKNFNVKFKKFLKRFNDDDFIKAFNDIKKNKLNEEFKRYKEDKDYDKIKEKVYNYDINRIKLINFTINYERNREIIKKRIITKNEIEIKIIDNLIKDYYNRIINLDKSLYGFIKNSSNEKLICDIKVLLKKRINKNKEIFICNIDIEKAFENIDRVLLFKLIKEFNINEDYYQDQEFIEELINKRCEKNKGLPQGSSLSPILFNIFINKGIENIKKKYNIELFAYADDIILITDKVLTTDKTLNIEFLKLIEKELNLKINNDKTKTLKINKESDKKYIEFLGFLIFNNGKIINKERFQYLKNDTEKLKDLILNIKNKYGKKETKILYDKHINSRLNKNKKIKLNKKDLKFKKELEKLINF